MEKNRRGTRSPSQINEVVVVVVSEDNQVNKASDDGSGGVIVVANQKKRKPRRKAKTNVVMYYYPYVKRPVSIGPKVPLKGVGSFHTVDKTRYPQILFVRQELQVPGLSDELRAYLTNVLTTMINCSSARCVLDALNNALRGRARNPTDDRWKKCKFVQSCFFVLACFLNVVCFLR